MATTIASSRIWNGLKVDEVTYTETGKIELNSTGGSLLASSSDYNWEIENTELFTRLYNNRARYSAQLTTTEFEKTFYNEGRLLFNADRAEILNDNVNYSNLTAAENNRTQFFKNGIPGLQNPVTGQVVNNDGSVTEGNPFGSTPGFLANGTPSQFGSASFPNDDLIIASLTAQDTEGTTETARAAGLRSGGAPTLRYPLNTSEEFQGDYLKIDIHKYSARFYGQSTGGQEVGDLGASGGLEPGAAPGDELIDKDSRSTVNNRKGERTGTIFLPLQTGLKESNKVKFSGEELNFIEAAFGQAAYAAILKGAENPLDVSGMASAAIKTLREKTISGLSDKNTENFLKAYFAGQAVNKDFVRRGTGAIANPNLELFFQGPELRDFSFQFQLTPRDQLEANRIREIIQLIKKSIHPNKSNQGVFLLTPDIFQLTYVFNGGTQHPFLHKFKPTAMTSFDVSYGNQRQYMTYEDGSMPTYNLTMTFMELEPIYGNDNKNISGSMGY